MIPALVLAAAIGAATPADLRPVLCATCELQLDLADLEADMVGNRKTNARISVAIMVTAVILVAAWDLFAYLTESRILADVSKQWTVLPLSVGILAGHWFWHARSDNHPYLMAAVFGAFLVWDLSFLLRGPATGLEAEIRNPAVPLFFGIAVGRLLWSQR